MIQVRVKLPKSLQDRMSPANRLRANNKIGQFLVRQTRERFRTQGASGGKKWPGRWLNAIGAGRGLRLGGLGGGIAKSFKYKATVNGVVLYSDNPNARRHQLGTVGKGGVLPDPKLKNAKAFFIPITDRARTSEVWKFKGGDAIRMGRVKGKLVDLKRGRLKDGILEVWDENQDEWVQGRPDFIFLKKVSYPPTPMLPDSPAEKQMQKQFIKTVYS